MNESTPAETWLRMVLQRLSSDGFSISHNVSFEGQEFMAVAHRSRFELTKFGNSETFFVFGSLQTCDADSIRGFSSLAFKFAKRSKSFPLPCGLFEFVCCFAVCLADALDESTADSVRRVMPRKHWAAAEIPVVFDCDQGRVCFLERTPLWGAAYYKGFRNQIAKYLAVSQGA